MCYNIYFINISIIPPFFIYNNQFYVTSRNFFLNTLYFKVFFSAHLHRMQGAIKSCDVKKSEIVFKKFYILLKTCYNNIIKSTAEIKNLQKKMK